MLEQSNAPKTSRKRFVSCEICKHRSFRVMGKKRDFMGQFPLNEARCKEWVRRVGNEDLAYVPIEKLHMLKYLCGQHFTPRDFNRKKSRLRRTAIPSLNLKHPPLSDEIMACFPLHMYHRNQSDTDDANNNEEIGKPSQPDPPSPSFVDMKPKKVDPSLIIPYIVSDAEYEMEPQILSNLPTSLPYEDLIDEPPEENNEAPLVVRLSNKRKPIAETEKNSENTAVVTLDPLTNNPTLLIKPKTDVTPHPEVIIDEKGRILLKYFPTPSNNNDLTDSTNNLMDSTNNLMDSTYNLMDSTNNLTDSTNIIETSNVGNSDNNINKNQYQQNKTKSDPENIDEEQVLPEDLPNSVIPDVLLKESRHKRGITLKIQDYIVPVTRGEKILYEYLLQVRTRLAKLKYLVTKLLFSLKVAKNIVSNPELLATVEHFPSTQKLLTLIPPIDQRPHYKTSVKHKIEAVYILTKAPYGYEFLSEMLTLPRSDVLVKLIRQANKIMSIVNSMYESNEKQTVPL
ncbi:PREDICTED: uncharacterized protein LOC106106763 isoform X2 [Papilio polytes]|uniref:uncharacterized protein LOC106106763 isoform X2 n=1 Tax=Papilio polytes TaxID=76194 RepID=UPI000675E11F|nr:PREDICTED: uncharacterized protein LOC106106763 isoform X2 [Papilio polytes]